MLIGFHRGLAIPLWAWAVAFSAVALSAPPRVMPSLIALFGIAVMAATMPVVLRWFRSSRRPVDVLPAADRDPSPAGITVAAAIRVRTLDEAIAARTREADDALDLVRMDDDGGWQMAGEPAPTGGPADLQDQRHP